MAMTKTRDYVSVDPVSSPVTVEDARLHLDLDDNYYDSQLDRLIDVARRRVEQDTRRSLVTQTHVLSMDSNLVSVHVFGRFKQHTEPDRPQ